MGNTHDRYSELLIEDPSIGDFDRFEQTLSCLEPYWLGYPYVVWKAACRYKFMIAGTVTHKPCDISNFIEIEQDVISGFITGKEWAILPMFILKAVAHNSRWKSRYIHHIEDTRADPVIPDLFKNQVIVHMMVV
jgi:hypothetical protein